MKESSLKISLSTLTLLSLAAIASTPALANSAPTSDAETQPKTTAVQGQSLPFFARFLEGQSSATATDSAAPTLSERIALTDDTKVTTKKYPSDQEDGSDVKIPTTKPPQKPGDRLNFTRKYPSDQEDNTGDRPSRYRDRIKPTIPSNGGQVTTQKYPSDNEDGGVTNINNNR